jgi:hypothetical protein
VVHIDFRDTKTHAEAVSPYLAGIVRRSWALAAGAGFYDLYALLLCQAGVGPGDMFVTVFLGHAVLDHHHWAHLVCLSATAARD